MRKVFALCASFALLCLSYGQARAGPQQSTQDLSGQVVDLPGQPHFVVAQTAQIGSDDSYVIRNTNGVDLGGGGPPRSRLTVSANFGGMHMTFGGHDHHLGGGLADSACRETVGHPA